MNGSMHSQRHCLYSVTMRNKMKKEKIPHL